ncbi:MAG TPA: serine/threonine-protein kinase, partial [Polyangiaceae bacterium LLY-WYZ-15_(1-7)]|nr:serine/threonine-protein kinase [Polyangiaceae bacterium LLY-WYZ-15_(1-7)]
MKAGSIVGGRYRLEALLASGGMGAVWRAEHTMSERRVALKLVRALGGLDEATVRRFKREATAPSAIGHPGIVEVLDAGVEPEEGLLFLAMELLEGESLRARLRRPETGRGEALRLVRALLDPLAAAHAGGWVHRDLKPENVFLAETPRSEAAGGGSGGDSGGDSGEGPGEVVKLLDFGLVRSVGGPSATLTGSAIGTPGYMAPEQAMSAKAVTARADVWAVGALLYEALAGAPPFEGETPHAQIMRACAEAHEPLVERVPGVPAALSALVDRCLAKVPDDRPADAAEVA